MEKVTSDLGFEKGVNRDTQRPASGTEVVGGRVLSALAYLGDYAQWPGWRQRRDKASDCMQIIEGSTGK